MKKLLSFTMVLALLTLALSACAGGGLPDAKSNLGTIEGVIDQETDSVVFGGSVKLMAEKYHKATPDATVTLQPSESIEMTIGEDHKFVISDIQPGRYFLDASVSLNPCFLGAPGQVFNGMSISMMENWTAIGLSFKDGTSLVTGKTDVYDIVASEPLSVTLQLPKCY